MWTRYPETLPRPTMDMKVDLTAPMPRLPTTTRSAGRCFVKATSDSPTPEFVWGNVCGAGGSARLFQQAVQEAEQRAVSRAEQWAGQWAGQHQVGSDAPQAGSTRQWQRAPEAPPAAGSTWRWMSRLARLLSGRLCTTWGQQQGVDSQGRRCVEKEAGEDRGTPKKACRLAGLQAALCSGRRPAAQPCQCTAQPSPVRTWCSVWRQRSSSAFTCCSQFRDSAAT